MNDTQKLTIVPIFQKPAFKFVAEHHRHHKPPVGSVFQIAVSNGKKIVGVAIVGRPVAIKNQDGLTLEVTRLCTDGTKNVCSMLYAASWRACKALGYNKLITYILKEESGVSLKAAGWKIIGERRGYTWNSKSRPRIDKHSTQNKIKFQAA